MSDTWVVGIGFDTSQAQAGAAGLKGATDAAGEAAVDLQKNVHNVGTELNKSTGHVKEHRNQLGHLFHQYGVTGREMQRFAQFGLSVFTGQIVAKALGFSSILAIVELGAESVAEGIRDVGEALRNKLAPELEHEIEKQREWAKVTKENTDRLIELRKEVRGPGVELRLRGADYGPNGKVAGGPEAQERISTKGLNAENELKLREFVDSAQKQIDFVRTYNQELDAIRRSGRNSPVQAGGASVIVGSANQPLEGEEIYQRLVDRAKDYRAELIASQDAQEKITSEVVKQVDAFKFLSQGTQISQGIGRFILAGARQLSAIGSSIASSIPDNSAHARAFNDANQQGQLAQLRANREYGSGVANSIVGGFKTAADVIARAFSSSPGAGNGGSQALENQIYAQGQRDQDSQIAQGMRARRIEDQKEYIRLLQEEADLKRQADVAFNHDVGNRLAEGLTDVIGHANQAHAIFQNLIADLDRMALNKFFTQMIGNGIGNILSGYSWGGQKPVNPGPIGEGPGGIEFPSGDGTLHAGGFGGGSIFSGGIGSLDGGFRITTRQRRDTASRRR